AGKIRVDGFWFRFGFKPFTTHRVRFEFRLKLILWSGE
ncbi:unnamed protein product, partial [Linum tenue]